MERLSKIISSIIKQSEYLDEELLSKANNKLYTPDEFNNALKNLNMASQFFLCTLIYPLFLGRQFLLIRGLYQKQEDASRNGKAVAVQNRILVY